MHRSVMGFTAVVLALQPSAAMARNILVTNDDGLTSNVVALYRALKEQGHDVIVSVPCTNQSGMGAALGIAERLTPLETECRNRAAAKGDPGAGPVTRPEFAQGDFYYVSGTPVAAFLYGLDVVAERRWNTEPDLVLSGPNEGQNVGAVTLSSGTVSNAQYAAARGLPAIAVSAGQNTTGDVDLNNPLSAEVARRTVELVNALDDRASAGRILPSGVALNVNFPDELAGAEWNLARIGTYSAYHPTFTESLARSASPSMVAAARERGLQIPDLPGISFERNEAAPRPEQAADEAVVYREAIAVSPMQAGYEAAPVSEQWLHRQLDELLPAGDQ